MYTRNYTRTNRKYTPPPGYDGNAFPDPDTPSVKYHEAEDGFPRRPMMPQETVPPQEPEDIAAEERYEEPEREPVAEAPPSPAQISPFEEGVRSVESLFRHLRGNFGREELILVLVMLLISSDANVELLLLALLLAVR